MKSKNLKRILSALLTLVMIVGAIPSSVITVFAGHTCPDCNDWIDGSPYCEECYKCDACVDLCIECGKCTDCSGSEICDGCSDEEIGDKMCLECAYDRGTHCPDCEGCYLSAPGWCEECGLCGDCADIDNACSSVHGMTLCFECAIDKDTHCPGCDVCYGEVEHFCGECGLCNDCSDYDEECSEVHGIDLCSECAVGYGSHCPNCQQCYFDVQGWCEECMLCIDCVELDEGCSGEVGAVICEECAIDYGHHCPNCDLCYFKSSGWCEECGQCDDCSPACLYCCEEAGEVICVECAIDNNMHCPECSECYGECDGEFCTECGVCGNCAEINPSEELCIECAIAAGYHCPGCESYIGDVPLCEGCGECCLECAEAFCENCNLCSNCVLICQDCGSCEECADICPNCEEYCSECVGICDDCDLCLVCCEDFANYAGCDCGEWVCVEHTDWDEHFSGVHTDAEQIGHAVRPSPTWDWDSTYHWHKCVYCDDDVHLTNRSKHTFDGNGICTVCRYVKDAKIQILVQPSDSKAALVTSADEDYDERNIARFSVKAAGKSKLTYTWYEGYYHHGLGTIKYTPLTDPVDGECFEGSEIYWLVPTDACYKDWYIRCVISDIYGNEITTRDALVQARHHYQYFEWYLSNQRPCELAQRSKYGHILQCVGEGCEKVTHLRPHEDEDRDGYCDICDYEIGKILITKQPKDVKNVYVSSADEDYDESNIAHFSVEAEGESKLTYTWCRKQYVGGKLTYVPLTHPQSGENYDGPDLDLLVPTDSCSGEYTYACIITDEEGNETRTVDVVLQAKHNYQYYKQYQSHENPYPYAKRIYSGHILQCVGEGCGKITRLRQHVDKNNDYFCDVCDKQKDIMEIGLTVTVPKEGQLPSYTVGTESVAYFAMGGNIDYTQYRFWFVSDNGTDNWKLIDKNTPFVAGKYYKFVVEMQTKSQYEFPSYNGAPNFWAKVNGDYVMPQKTYGMDPSHYVTVSYEFGVCNDSMIENIVIDNVTTPVAGEKPTYTATVRGSGYYINTDKNVYYDAYWKNPPEKWYYIKNGIGWFDMTKGDWVYENETFIPGHEYQVNVYLKTDDGYEFKLSKWLDIEFTASVNGFAAEGINNSDSRTQQTISTTLACEGKKLSTVMVNGLATPKAGETPDYTATAAYPEWYQLDPNYGGTGGIIWYDSEGNMMDPTDTFIRGEKYRVEIKVISTTLDGVNMSQFVSPVSAYVNGNQVVENGNWDAVYAGKNAVYIYYTFGKGASSSGAGVSVSGKITSYRSETDPVTLQLIPYGTSEVAYETVVSGNMANYELSGVQTGDYTVRVMKKNHASREYALTVDSDIVFDVKINLMGDINGDGNINARDTNMYKMVLKNAKTIDEYQWKCADVTGDGKVSSRDTNKMKMHLANKGSIWS